jgi:hypothetical protein
MNLDRYMKRSWHALAGALALAATAALANPVASQASIPQDSMRLALADSGQTGAEAVGSATPRSYPANSQGSVGPQRKARKHCAVISRGLGWSTTTTSGTSLSKSDSQSG